MYWRTTLIVAVAVCAVASLAMAQENAVLHDRACTPAGTWVGGSGASMYLMHLVPVTPWRYVSEAQGSYLPSETFNAVASTWVGETHRYPQGQWGGWAVQVASASGVLFPDPADITIGAVRSTNEFVDCDTMVVTIDFFEIYYWNSIYGADPTKELLVDPGDIPAPPTPIVETYHRVSAPSN
jgi:hypothetical protein